MSALAAILAHPAVWRGDRLGGVATPGLATGFPALDAELPGGGWQRLNGWVKSDPIRASATVMMTRY